MALNLNKVILAGRIGSISYQNQDQDKPFITMQLATNENWRIKDSEDWKQKTEWHNILVSGNKVNYLKEMDLKKGDLIYLEGKIKYKKTEDDKYYTNIELNDFEGLIKIVTRHTKENSDAIETIGSVSDYLNKG